MKYRIVENSKIGLDVYGDKFVQTKYYPQYKLWGLIWIPIRDNKGNKMWYYEEDAHIAIERHAKLIEMKEQCKTTRIIYVDDDCITITHKK